MWKSLSCFFFLLSCYSYIDNLMFFPRADMISPPASLWSSWWEDWKKKPIHSPATSYSSASSQLLPRIKHRTLLPDKQSPPIILSLLLNFLCFHSLCNLNLSPTVNFPTHLSNEPFSSAPWPADWELRPPKLIPAALFRARTDPPWSYPRLTLPVSPLAYCLSLHNRKGPSKFTYPSLLLLSSSNSLFGYCSFTFCALRRTSEAV